MRCPLAVLVDYCIRTSAGFSASAASRVAARGSRKWKPSMSGDARTEGRARHRSEACTASRHRAVTPDAMRATIADGPKAWACSSASAAASAGSAAAICPTESSTRRHPTWTSSANRSQ